MLFRESGVGSINNPQVDFFLLSPITCLKNINGPNCSIGLFASYLIVAAIYLSLAFSLLTIIICFPENKETCITI